MTEDTLLMGLGQERLFEKGWAKIASQCICSHTINQVKGGEEA